MKGKYILILLLLFILSGVFFAVRHFLLLNKNIILYGNIEIRQSDLSFRVKGRLLKLYKEEGDYAYEGELLAELEPDTYKTALNKAKGTLKERRAQKLQSAAVYEYNYPLCADFTISKEECANVKYDMEQTRAAYESAVANLEEAIINLEDTKLYAPYNGIILTRIVEKGTILETNSPVYSISMIEPVWVRAYIEEKDLGKVRLGQKALVYTDARPKNPYSAHIGFVSPVAEFTPKTVETTNLRTDLVYRLRIIIDDTDLYLRQGMPVTIRLLDE